MLRRVLALTFLLSLSTGVMGQPGEDSRTPGSTITEAKWADYAQMYEPSPLCAKDEVTLWTCESSRGKTFSLCASEHVTRDSGYFQYRASKKGRLVFSYPEVKSPPFQRFTYLFGASGNASLEFANAGYRYSLNDPLRSGASIFVTAPGGRTKEIACERGGGTLQINYTMRLMFDSGVWPYP
jgi:hypothetical protein